MNNERFYIHTYGCQMNQRDSEAIAELLCRHGMQATDEAAATVIIVNTCSVREKAETKAIGKLGLLVASKRTYPKRLVGVMGCMAQRLGPALFDRYPALDFIVGTRAQFAIPGIIEQLRNGATRIIETTMNDSGEELPNGHREGALSAYVNILFGCERRCSYCIVPDVRGPEWSRPASSIVHEVTCLAASGVREVTLLGQSVMRYGIRNDVWPTDMESPRGYREPLPRLLEALNDIDGIARVRFTSSHPTGCTTELAHAMASLPAACPHIHIPVQSGSDRILRLMRRGYTAEQYEAAVATLRKQVPELAVTTDVIVGFPSESVDDFEATRKLLHGINADQTFIFKYSPRPGTPAFEMPDDVDEDEKMRRNQVLLSDQDQRSLSIHQALIGTSLEVLAEGPSLRNKQNWSGRTGTNKIVIFKPAPGCRAGDIGAVMIERSMPQTLYGKWLS